MLLQEARWFRSQLAELEPAAVYPLCNLGSATAEFRERVQPWIDRYLFAPARVRGYSVVHVDVQQAPGVDLVGDLDDEQFVALLAGMNFRSALCCNLLEHVADPGRMAAAITRIIPPGGYVLASVPRRFPYHPDPIDTMFRPDPADLAALFPGTRIERQRVLNCGTLLHYIAGRARNPSMLWKSIVQKTAPLPRTSPQTACPAAGTSPGRYLPWLFKSFQVTCLVLRKEH